jgi:hypothetical protein
MQLDVDLDVSVHLGCDVGVKTYRAAYTHAYRATGRMRYVYVGKKKRELLTVGCFSLLTGCVMDAMSRAYEADSKLRSIAAVRQMRAVANSKLRSVAAWAHPCVSPL